MAIASSNTRVTRLNGILAHGFVVVMLFGVVAGAPAKAKNTKGDFDPPVAQGVSELDGFEWNFGGGGYFEGDLKLSPEKMERFTGEKKWDQGAPLNDNSEGGMRRSLSIDDTSMLWPGRKMSYYFDDDVSQQLKDAVRQAMTIWSSKTCVTFEENEDADDNVIFTEDEEGCYSTVGRDGGTQTINLSNGKNGDDDGDCRFVSVALHEIGHALGLFHEQSRPDRSNFITINSGNIISDQKHNFEVRSNSITNYQGNSYDYRSIMQYSIFAFSKNDKATSTINNQVELASQGMNDLAVGALGSLSMFDILAMKRLYNCPGAGREGSLRVYVEKGKNLPDTDYAGLPDPYVEIHALKSDGQVVTKKSKIKDGTVNPYFSQTLDFGEGNWQLFWLRTMDDDGYLSPDQMTMAVTVPLIGPSAFGDQMQDLKSCSVSGACSSNYLLFDYGFIPTVTCSSTVCKNGAQCISGYTGQPLRCTCSSDGLYTGRFCEHRRRTLRVKLWYAQGLPNLDSIFLGKSDPYVQVTAFNMYPNAVSNSTTKRTVIRMNTANPYWNETLDFGEQIYSHFVVQVFDSDQFDSIPSGPDPLSQAITFKLSYSDGSVFANRFISQKVPGSAGSFFYLDYYYDVYEPPTTTPYGGNNDIPY